MMNFDLFANRSFLTLRLAFWRLMAFLAEHAVQHKPIIQRMVPFLPLLGFGTLSYILGLAVGGFIKILAG
jgi:hypothetical protein